MQSNEFRIITRWTAEGSLSEVAAILRDAERFTDWWGDVYLGIRVLDRGDANGVGGRVAIHSKGWLPYRLNWVGTLTEANFPHSWVIEAAGDLTGRGVWTLTQNGQQALVVYDWRVTADRPLFRVLAPVFGPILAWNHRWAMQKGEEGLRRELIRRRLT
jgi:hypothetical protein